MQWDGEQHVFGEMINILFFFFRFTIVTHNKTMNIIHMLRIIIINCQSRFSAQRVKSTKKKGFFFAKNSFIWFDGSRFDIQLKRNVLYSKIQEVKRCGKLNL